MAAKVEPFDPAAGKLTKPVRTNAAGQQVPEVQQQDFDPYADPRPAGRDAGPGPAAGPDRVDAFKRKRVRVRFDLSDGSLHMVVLDARKAGNGWLLSHDPQSESPLFEPRVGSTLGLSVAGSDPVQVYYPGIRAELPGLGVGLMAFVEAPQS
jgi:hypothetical protein